MGRLSLQLGAALVVPFAAQRRRSGGGPNWRIRALRAAAVDGDVWGSPVCDCRRPPLWVAVPARPRAPARTAGG